MISMEQAALIVSCLDSCNARFSQYQAIPDFIRSALPSVGKAAYEKQQLDLDGPRYDFLVEQTKLHNLRVTEIGSNLGYFGLRLAHDFNCQYLGFEPLQAYCRAAGVMAEAVGLASRCRFTPMPVGLADIPALPDSDLIVELNVLHHGGAIFDRDAVDRYGSWMNYAVARLGALRKKASALLFQTGNVADNRSLFPTEQAVSFVFNLLSTAGWTPLRFGTVEDLVLLTYVSRDARRRAQARTYVCRRNPATNMVEYRVGGRLVGSLITGLANRPIWFCK
jgi:hypothetical protein